MCVIKGAGEETDVCLERVSEFLTCSVEGVKILMCVLEGVKDSSGQRYWRVS